MTEARKAETWDRQPWDTDLSYRLFELWMKQTPPRSLDVAWREYKGNDYDANGRPLKAPAFVRQMADGMMDTQMTGQYPQVGWDERVRTFDIMRQREEMVLWTERRNVVRKSEWEMALALMDKARQMLEWPIFEEEMKQDENEEGAVTYIVRTPARWAVRDIQAMAKIASELARLATEMEQGRFAVEMSIRLSPEALQALDLLEKKGLKYGDVVREFEQIIIGAAKKLG